MTYLVPRSSFLRRLAAPRASTWVVLAALCGCGASIPPQLNAAARADLMCDQVEVDEAGTNRFVATGCGRGVLYARSCGDAGCTWARVPTAEQAAPPPTSGGDQLVTAPAPPREVIQAPPPAQPQPREVIPAPPPAEPQMRQVIPAPPPASADPQGALPQGALDEAAQQAGVTPQPVPLSQGDLSAPYQAEVPEAPAVQRSEYPPPAALVETPPPAPQPTYVWVGGYWWWNQPSWVWAPGYWCPPRYGFSYVPGSWYWSSNYWWYGPGGWARPGSTLIVQHVHPRPSRVQVTRSFTPYHHVVGHGYTPPQTARALGGGPARSYAPTRGYGASPSYVAPGAPAGYAAPRASTGTVAPRASTRGVVGFTPGRYVSGNPQRPVYAPSGAPASASNRAVVGSQGYGRAPAQGSFTPQASPLYRYPTQLSSPVRAPRGGPAGAYGGRDVSGRAPAVRSTTGYGAGNSSRFGSGFNRSASPQPAPVYRSAPLQVPRSHDVARGSVYGGGGGSYRGSAAPLRAPSSGGARIAPRGARVAPRR